MEKHLFVVRSPLGKEIYSTELPVNSRLIPFAQTLMDVVSYDFPHETVEYCEIWERTAHHSLMPELEWSVETSAFSYFLSVLKVAGYMFPWGTVVAICGLIVGLSIFRVVIAFIKAIWDLLPFA